MQLHLITCNTFQYQSAGPTMNFREISMKIVCICLDYLFPHDFKCPKNDFEKISLNSRKLNYIFNIMKIPCEGHLKYVKNAIRM